MSKRAGEELAESGKAVKTVPDPIPVVALVGGSRTPKWIIRGIPLAVYYGVEVGGRTAYHLSGQTPAFALFYVIGSNQDGIKPGMVVSVGYNRYKPYDLEVLSRYNDVLVIEQSIRTKMVDGEVKTYHNYTGGARSVIREGTLFTHLESQVGKAHKGDENYVVSLQTEGVAVGYVPPAPTDASVPTLNSFTVQLPLENGCIKQLSLTMGQMFQVPLPVAAGDLSIILGERITCPFPMNFLVTEDPDLTDQTPYPDGKEEEDGTTRVTIGCKVQAAALDVDAYLKGYCIPVEQTVVDAIAFQDSVSPLGLPFQLPEPFYRRGRDMLGVLGHYPLKDIRAHVANTKMFLRMRKDSWDMWKAKFGETRVVSTPEHVAAIKGPGFRGLLVFKTYEA